MNVANTNIFAFIGHFLSPEHFYLLTGWRSAGLRYFPNQILKNIIPLIPPYKFMEIPPLVSKKGSVTSGYALITPFLPEHLMTLGEESVLNKVIAAGRLAESLGARVVGLAGFTSIVGNEGEEFSKRLRIPVTSGNTLTAALALQGIRRAAAMMEISLKEATVAVIGASGDIGSICTKILSKESSHLHLAARNERRLEDFANQVRKDSNCSIKVMKYVREAIREADIVLTATSSITTLIDPEDLKPGAIVCDVAIPHNVGIEILQCRNDVLVFEGGLAKLPHPLKTRDDDQWNKIFPNDITVFGCLAETMLLSLEGRFENYSIGRGNITEDRIAEIESLASQHGFELANFRYRETTFTDEEIEGKRAKAY